MSEKQEIVFKCEPCKFETCRKDNYQRHLSNKKHKILTGIMKKPVIEKEIIKHKCNFCNYESDRLYNLEIHIKSQHTNKEIKCLLCNKEFIGDSEYNKHILTEEHYDNNCIQLVTIRGKLKKIKEKYFNNLFDDIRNENHNNFPIVDISLRKKYNGKTITECIYMTNNKEMINLLDNNEKNKFEEIYIKLNKISSEMKMYENLLESNF